MFQFIRLLVLGLVFYTSAFADSSPGYTPLFTLERTLNKNQVVYEVNPGSDVQPIHAFWIMLAQDGHHEELTSMERKRAYGVNVISQNAHEIQFVIRSLTTHPITVHLNDSNSRPYATLKLSGGEKILKRIFITASGGLIPKVKQIDIYYQDTLESPIKKEILDLNSNFLESSDENQR